MFHVCERKEDFVYSAQTLVQQNEMFENVNFVGADCSAALCIFRWYEVDTVC